jgi:N-acyl homoserine lactone hydrolase
VSFDVMTTFHSRKGWKMPLNTTILKKLYVLQLSATTIPLPGGRTLEMSSGCYLLETNDGKRILIDSGMPADAVRPEGAPPSRNEKNVLEHLTDLKLRPDDIDTLICTHFDIDHCGYHDSFPEAELIVQREHYNIARDGHARFADARHHWDHASLRYRMVDSDTELLPGLTLLETSGHAPAHQSVLVRLPKTGFVLLAIDAVMLQRQFSVDRQPWPKDDNHEQVVASTCKLLDIVEREQVALTIFGHDGPQWEQLKKAPAFYD